MRTTTQKFAVIAGVVYVALFVMGLIPGLHTPPPPTAPPLAVEMNYGYLMGIFPHNIVHGLVHLAVGIWGLAAATTFGRARQFSKGLAVIYGVLAVMGLFPVLNTFFGLVPLWGAVVALHGATAIVAAYFGWVHGRERAVREPISQL